MKQLLSTEVSVTVWTESDLPPAALVNEIKRAITEGIEKANLGLALSDEDAIDFASFIVSDGEYGEPVYEADS